MNKHRHTHKYAQDSISSPRFRHGKAKPSILGTLIVFDVYRGNPRSQPSCWWVSWPCSASVTILARICAGINKPLGQGRIVLFWRLACAAEPSQVLARMPCQAMYTGTRFGTTGTGIGTMAAITHTKFRRSRARTTASFSSALPAKAARMTVTARRHLARAYCLLHIASRLVQCILL